MGKIKIGADELILWLRKNEKAVGKTNEILGEDIRKIIENKETIDGKKLEKEPCYWCDTTGDAFVGKYKLPEHATQYEIDVNQLPALFKKIMDL